ncbi:MAG: hypothetical protein ACYS0I_14730 [Planctomycetota bacterium]|jgi:hypothetical protein
MTEKKNEHIKGRPLFGFADLHEDNIVDELDLKLFVDEWLYYCPLGWPLK